MCFLGEMRRSLPQGPSNSQCWHIIGTCLMNAQMGQEMAFEWLTSEVGLLTKATVKAGESGRWNWTCQ